MSEADWPNAEPFRIKVVEPIKLLSRAEREKALERAGLNLFLLSGAEVFIDLLTDSGTGAMSDNQWAGIMLGDESYAGSRNYYNLEKAVQDIFSYPYFLPTHQGRGAENVLFPLLIGKEQYVPGNMHFDTTQAHIQLARGIGVNLVTEKTFELGLAHPFKGNIDTDRLEAFIKNKGSSQIAFILMTITCNSVGGQPVSMANMKEVNAIARRSSLPLFIDAARFAENAYFIKGREQGYADKTIKEITREFFALADGFTMSAKKDGLVNIGGLIGIREDLELLQKAKERLVPLEGFITYGGMAGRDMEALARGLYEVIDENYLEQRISQVAFLGKKILELGVIIQQPVGGHAVFVDGKSFLPHIPQEQFPSHALCVELYREGGIRAVEIGTLMAGRDPLTGKNIKPELDLLRLAIPRRVYTDNHLAFVAEAFRRLQARKDSIKGLALVYEPKILRHFTARFTWT